MINSEAVSHGIKWLVVDIMVGLVAWSWANTLLSLFPPSCSLAYCESSIAVAVRRPEGGRRGNGNDNLWRLWRLRAEPVRWLESPVARKKVLLETRVADSCWRKMEVSWWKQGKSIGKVCQAILQVMAVKMMLHLLGIMIYYRKNVNVLILWMGGFWISRAETSCSGDAITSQVASPR